MTELEAQLLQRLTALLDAMSYQKRPCRLCGTFVYWIQTHRGERYCLEASGERHLQRCPRTPTHELPKRPRHRQDPLFGPDPEQFLDPV